jgi:ribosomal protein L11 methylase PrmA
LLPLLSAFLFALAAFLAYFFLSGFIWGAGYFPTSRSEIESVAKLLDVSQTSKFYDLGSGYGMLIIAISEKFGASCVGVEIDPIKCWWTRFAVKRKKLDGRVKVVHSNFLNVDLSGADSVFVFLSGEGGIMDKVRAKVLREMKPGSRVVSFVHKFKTWVPEKIEGRLSLYIIPPETSKISAHEPQTA